jgi:hypothetical protein
MTNLRIYIFPSFPVLFNHCFDFGDPFTLWQFIPFLFKPSELEAGIHHYCRVVSGGFINKLVVLIELASGFLTANKLVWMENYDGLDEIRRFRTRCWDNSVWMKKYPTS